MLLGKYVIRTVISTWQTVVMTMNDFVPMTFWTKCGVLKQNIRQTATPKLPRLIKLWWVTKVIHSTLQPSDSKIGSPWLIKDMITKRNMAEVISCTTYRNLAVNGDLLNWYLWELRLIQTWSKAVSILTGLPFGATKRMNRKIRIRMVDPKKRIKVRKASTKQYFHPSRSRIGSDSLTNEASFTSSISEKSTGGSPK